MARRTAQPVNEPEEEELPLEDTAVAEDGETGEETSEDDAAGAEAQVLPRPIIRQGFVPGAPTQSMQAAEEGTVTMIFKKPVRLTLDDNSQVHFPAGASEVPESLADHWYLRAHGVRAHKKK